ncbi:MAG: extracellular solute-binding protein [Candidatus Zixiibacteriota bacterium]
MLNRITVSGALLLVWILSFSCEVKQEKREMTVLIRMMDIQDLWFRQKVKEFEKENQVTLHIVTFDHVEDVKGMIELEKKTGRKRIGLVKTPKEMVSPLVKENLMIPLGAIVDSVQLTQDLSDYLTLAVEGGRVEGKVYYLPRKLETYLLFYLKSKLEDALQNWEKQRGEIEDLMRRVNGFGLPKDFRLESDPSQWDYYDLAVLGYFWAHTDYTALSIPRIAHRGKRYAGTVNEMATRIFQLGGDKEDLIAMNTDPVIDFFQWESFFIENGLYHPNMWEKGWSGGDIWRAISEGQVFLAYMHQIDLFFIHGGSDPTMLGYLSDPEDMGVAVMPKGVSLETDPKGKPKREGFPESNFYGWWWGIPVTSPDPLLSYRLARFITSYQNQIVECTRFGMFPVRRDILDNIGNAFDSEWKKRVFEVTRAQFERGTEDIPEAVAWPQIGKNYLDAWYEIAVNQHITPREKIRLRLEKYAKLNQDLLSSP